MLEVWTLKTACDRYEELDTAETLVEAGVLCAAAAGEDITNARILTAREQLKQIAEEKDELAEGIYELVSENIDDLLKIQRALSAVMDVIECTYGVDDNGELDPDAEPADSAADVFEMVCNLGIQVSDALIIATDIIGVPTTGEPEESEDKSGEED
jgi:hypothetical protein